MKALRYILQVLLCICLIVAVVAAILSSDEIVSTDYYSSIQAALTDASCGSTENSDSAQGRAEAAVNVYESGRYEVLLLKNTSVKSDIIIEDAYITFKLGGRRLELCGSSLIVSGGELVIDGGGGELSSISDKDDVYGIRVEAISSSYLTVKNLNVFVSGKSVTLGVACLKSAPVNITLDECRVSALCTGEDGGKMTAAFFTNSNTNAKIKINGGKYSADAKYRLVNADTGATSASGIKIQQTGGAAELDGVTAIGIHSGISSHTDMTIRDSYCASPTHGGMYNGGTLYAEDVTFANCKYSGECESDAEIAEATHYAAMYNGGSRREAKAYLNDCKFINGSASYGLVMTTNYGYMSPTAYISNCSIKNLRADGERDENPGVTSTVYIGKNVIFNLREGAGIIDRECYAGQVFKK